ncbi:hypothetical protein Syun_003955 [Stephania yunnanensis]|uniref:Retrotransposon Copia-like N-terminal domain-containing protein n=1 Tax=Stephania yunnanensis TaxID=152371 RepID=A0AAP0L3I9_9MAGN
MDGASAGSSSQSVLANPTISVNGAKMKRNSSMELGSAAVSFAEMDIVSTNPYQAFSRSGSTNPQNLMFANSLTQTLPMKIEVDNYMLWKSVLLALFRRNHLEGIVLGTFVCQP